MISVVIPFHWMKNWQFFMNRCLKSIEAQTYTDYEVILMKVGSMPVTSNRVIQAAKGDIVKVLYMDDYLAHENSLQEIADNFKGGWLVTGCIHNDGQNIGNPHYPTWNEEMKSGKNTIGSPSVLAFENKNPELFDVNMSWLLDCDIYDRLYKRFGAPTILNTFNVVIGIGDHQQTHLMSDEDKLKEHHYLNTK